MLDPNKCAILSLPTPERGSKARKIYLWLVLSMDKIASPQELASELRRILVYSGSKHPSRQRIALELRRLAFRVEPAFEQLHRLAGAQTRPLYEIAEEIRKDWKNVNFAAKPYLEAMMGLDKITDSYGMDSGKGIVLRFLSNASSWRGPKAKEIKTELKKMAK